MHLTFFTIQKLLNRGVFKFPLDYSLALRTTGGLHSEYHALLQGRAAVDMAFPFRAPSGGAASDRRTCGDSGGDGGGDGGDARA